MHKISGLKAGGATTIPHCPPPSRRLWIAPLSVRLLPQQPGAGSSNSLRAMPGKPGSALPPGWFFSDAVKMAPHSSSSSCWCGLSRWIVPCLHLLDESSAEPLNFFPGRALRADREVLNLPFGMPGTPAAHSGAPRAPRHPSVSPRLLSDISMSLLSYRRLFHAKAGSPVPHTEQQRRPTLPPVPCAHGEPSPAAVPSLSLSLSPARQVTAPGGTERAAARGVSAAGVRCSAPRALLNVYGDRAIPERKLGAAGGPPFPGQVQPWLLGSSCQGSSPGAGKRRHFGSPLGARPVPAGEGPGTPPGMAEPLSPAPGGSRAVLCNNAPLIAARSVPEPLAGRGPGCSHAASPPRGTPALRGLCRAPGWPLVAHDHGGAAVAGPCAAPGSDLPAPGTWQQRPFCHGDRGQGGGGTGQRQEERKQS